MAEVLVRKDSGITTRLVLEADSVFVVAALALAAADSLNLVDFLSLVGSLSLVASVAFKN